MTDIKENTTWQIESMDRQWMIDKIYEVIADKTLSKWCKVIIVPQDKYWDDIEYIMSRWDERPLEMIGKIIWHQVMIWDVLDYVEKNVKKKFFRETNSVWILDHWDDWRKPIDDQSIECLERVIWFV